MFYDRCVLHGHGEIGFFFENLYHLRIVIETIYYDTMYVFDSDNNRSRSIDNSLVSLRD